MKASAHIIQTCNAKSHCNTLASRNCGYVSINLRSGEKTQPYYFNLRLYILDGIHSASFEICQNTCRITSNLICPVKNLSHPSRKPHVSVSQFVE